METLICVNVVALVDPTIDAAKECSNGIAHTEISRAAPKSLVILVIAEA